MLHLIYKAESQVADFWSDSYNTNKRIELLESMAMQIAEKTKENIDREYQIKSKVNTVNLT